MNEVVWRRTTYLNPSYGEYVILFINGEAYGGYDIRGDGGVPYGCRKVWQTVPEVKKAVLTRLISRLQLKIDAANREMSRLSAPPATDSERRTGQ